MAGRIASLDGVRAFAIAMVLVGHASHTSGFPWKNWRFDLLANAGVRVFFVLSGYLITTLLLREKAQSGRVSLGNFYARRAYRILPAFYLYLLFVSALALVHRISIPHRDLRYAYAYLSNFRPGQHHLVGHLWSLSVEEQFYVAWPVMLAFMFASARNRVLLLAVLVPPALRYVMFSHPRFAPYVDQSFFTICDTLAVGCLLAVYRAKLHAFRMYRMALTTTGVFALLAFSVVLLESAKLSASWYQLTQSLLNVVIALLLDAFMVLRPPILNNRPVVLIGTWSYSIYLWQQLFCSSTGPWWELFPINLVLSVGVGYCSFRWVEQPILRLRKRKSETVHDSNQILRQAA